MKPYVYNTGHGPTSKCMHANNGMSVCSVLNVRFIAFEWDVFKYACVSSFVTYKWYTGMHDSQCHLEIPGLFFKWSMWRVLKCRLVKPDEGPISEPKRRDKSAPTCLVWALNNNIEFSMLQDWLTSYESNIGGPILHANLFHNSIW